MRSKQNLKKLNLIIGNLQIQVRQTQALFQQYLEDLEILVMTFTIYIKHGVLGLLQIKINTIHGLGHAITIPRKQAYKNFV